MAIAFNSPLPAGVRSLADVQSWAQFEACIAAAARHDLSWFEAAQGVDLGTGTGGYTQPVLRAWHEKSPASFEAVDRKNLALLVEVRETVRRLVRAGV